MWPVYLVLASVLTYAIYNRYFHPLAKVPGPFWASVTPLWLAWQSWHARRPRLDLELHHRYGSVVRIKPDEIIFSNPEYFKEVYGAGTKFRKSRFYEAPRDVHADGRYESLDFLTEQNIDKLRLQKRYTGIVYSTANVKKHEGKFDNNINRWFVRLKSNANRPLDFYHEVELLNVDLMTELTFARPFGAVERGSDGGHMHTMSKMWRWWSWIGCIPWLNEIDKAYAPWAKVFSIEQSMPLPVFPFAFGMIGQYDSTPKDSVREPCILDDLRNVTARDPKFLHSWGTALAITDEGAGVDTLSWTLSSIVAGVAMNTSVYENVRAELDSALESGAIVKGEPVPYDESVKLSYLQATIHEAMRIWPNIAISLPREVPAAGMTIDGYFIPGGWNVGINPSQLGRSTDIFGPDTSSFHPERWLEASKEKRSDMESRNLAFGGASRKCVGLHLAWLALSKLAASFFLEFDAKVLNELDGSPGPGGRIWREHGSFPTAWDGLEVAVTPR